MYTNVYNYGSKILLRGVENGRRISRKVDFSPTVWVNGKLNSKKNVETWKTMNGDTVYPYQPGTIRDCKDFIAKYEEVENFKIYTPPSYVYQFIAENYPGELHIDVNNVRSVYIDIETETEYGFPEVAHAREVIQLITIIDSYSDKVITWSLCDFTNDVGIDFRKFKAEEDLLKNFLSWWSSNYPDIITGWNTRFFDLPYLFNRIYRVLGEEQAKRLSPWNMCKIKEVTIYGKTQYRLHIAGVSDLDYLELYKKFTYKNRESYKLDAICEIELGQKKIKNPGTTFKEFYTQYPDTFVRYNIRDVKLVKNLDDKLKIIDLVLTLSYAAKINYEDVFSPVRTWDIIIYNYLNDHNTVIPLVKSFKDANAFEGAYVKNPLLGKHKWCCSFDLNSLYPHLIIQYNMSPETLTDVHLSTDVEKLLKQHTNLSVLQEYDYTVAANGWCFDRKKRGLLPIQMQHFYDQRVVYKKEMLKVKQQLVDTGDKNLEKEISRLNNLQMAMKILLNSAYGAFANPYFRYTDIRIAEGITLSGQLSIRWIENRLNEYLSKITNSEKDRVVLVDTDSVVLDLEDVVNMVFTETSDTEKVINFMDKFANDKLQPYINKSYQNLADYVNAYEQKMFMKRENLVDVALSIGKKNYVMSVYNSEGVHYKEPVLKIMGLQMVKSNIPAVIRGKLKESLKHILYGKEKDLQVFCTQVESEFYKIPYYDIAFPRGINDLTKYKDNNTIYKKATPIHVRAALLYNYYIAKKGLTQKYQTIQSGDKIKYIYLKTPNPLHENCIAFFDEIPEEFGLIPYIDYSVMYEKVFEGAMQNTIQVLKWSTREQATLDDIFIWE